jgi:hypothetical protein
VRFTPLRDFVSTHGQSATASRLGCTQGYISQALASHRAVFINELRDGGAEAIELKPFARPYPERDLDCINRLHAIGEATLAVCE